MGIYLNPGKISYEEAVNSDIFIDKTEMISFLNSVVKTKQKYVSVSRPRRFGKTMAADMLCAYYGKGSDSRSMFESLKIANQLSLDDSLVWDLYLGKFDVIRLVMTDFFKRNVSVENALDKLSGRVVDELAEIYPDMKLDKSDLTFSMETIHKNLETSFVLIIDEWDCPFRIRQDDKEGQAQYLDFLRDLLKDKSYIALAYMTGILPIKKYGQHSALNMFTEYSMIAPMQLAPYTGFTDAEVRELCKQYGRDYDKIKEWYDGYEVNDIIPPDSMYEILDTTGQSPQAAKYALYSPLSVINALRTGYIKNYWNKTETYEALAEYIRRDYDGLKEAVALLMDGGRVVIDTSTYQNDMTTFSGRDDILSLLIHLGYLGFDEEKSEVFIPNKEILDEFKTSTKSSEWVDTFKSFEISQKLLKATWECDEQKVAELIETAHDRAGNKTYNDESALSYAIQLAYYAAQKYYTTILELDTGKGYADIVYLPSPQYPDKPALLIELKYDRSAKGAISQIKNKNYPDRLEHYKGNIILVGINYDKEVRSDSKDYKHHTCVIEKA